MPRKIILWKSSIPEYNLPEITWIRDHYMPQEIELARQRLCSWCISHPCRMLPITTKGEDCPYFQQGPDLSSIVE